MNATQYHNLMKKKMEKFTINYRANASLKLSKIPSIRDTIFLTFFKDLNLKYRKPLSLTTLFANAYTRYAY